VKSTKQFLNAFLVLLRKALLEMRNACTALKIVNKKLPSSDQGVFGVLEMF